MDGLHIRPKGLQTPEKPAKISLTIGSAQSIMEQNSKAEAARPRKLSVNVDPVLSMSPPTAETRSRRKSGAQIFLPIFGNIPDIKEAHPMISLSDEALAGFRRYLQAREQGILLIE